MEDRSGGTCGCGGPTLSYTKDQILALHPPQHLPQSGRNGDDQSKASSGQVINHLRHSSFSSPTGQSPISAEGQGNSSWPPGLAAWVEQRIFPVLLPQQLPARGERAIEDQSVKPEERLNQKEGRQEIGRLGKNRGNDQRVLPNGNANPGGGEGEAWEEVLVKEDCDNTDPDILNEKFEALVDNMTPSEKEVRDKEAVLDSLKRVLRNRFPEVKLTPYGSSQSSLAFPGSDLDIFVWLGAEEEESMGGYFDEVEYGKSITKQVAQLLSAHPSKRYKGARAILANTPIVQVRDSITKVRCDLNMRNRMGVFNTAYIRFCADFDDRARDLMMVVKAFCKRHQLTEGSDHLNNYSLVLMVIFYLQTQFILHPLYQLQETPGLEPEIVNGHNFAYCVDRALLPPLPDNHQTLMELFEGFLDYFAFFPFGTHAICPLAGQEVSVEDLRSGTNLPSCLADKDIVGAPDRLRSIAILDPFELRRNVSHAVLPYIQRKIVNTFDMGARILQVALEGRDNQDELYLMLFEEGFYRFHFVYQPDPVTGLLPWEDPNGTEDASEEEGMEDEDEAKSEDESKITEEGGATHGKVVIEVGGEIPEKLVAAGELRNEENLGQKVIEVDTSDEELERYRGGLEDVGENQAHVKDKRICLTESQPSPRREIVVEVESDDEEPIMEDMDSMVDIELKLEISSC